ncbi:hypothetical protein JTE90_019737 [Oedothorax gibbosus]|uniref:Uncharacterized protein n=1 Tax=Oedothorax gibbosus TaxID=931172 RepID=A0AAV6UMF3_9ARAC|nr:hypothetical protein JTE90_019737 [Oedothorax gibbosus]
MYLSTCIGMIYFLCFTVECGRMIRRQPNAFVEIIDINNSTMEDSVQYNLTIEASTTDSTVLQEDLLTSIPMNETKVVGIVHPKYRMMPLAVGGITLLAGLMSITIVVGLFIYCNRRNDIVYEPATSVDIEQHI